MTEPAQDALEDWSSLQAVMEQLNAAESMAATLAALKRPAPASTEGEACLWTIDCDEAGTPAWGTVVGALPVNGLPPRAAVWERHALAELPFARLILDHPKMPVLIASIADEPRLDRVSRELWTAAGVAATIVASLTLRDRVVGVLTITWTREVPMGARVQRMYQALSRHAAPLLHNLVLAERQQALLAESQRERRLLRTVLDHVPVGILCIDGPTRRPLLTNRTARIMLAGREDPLSAPLPLTNMLHPGTDQPVEAGELAGVRAAITGEVQTRELDLMPPGRPRIAVETIGVPVHDAAGAVDQVVVLLRDMTSQKQAAEERARLQDEVIQAQAAALIERSTPLIPIREDLLVMPLVGTIDRERGAGILEVALQGARERRARALILDITGVPTIDAQAAAVLTQTAQALRLLGVEAVLSGVRPAVAEALVELDVPLAGITTCKSLQAAIEYATRRPGARR